MHVSLSCVDADNIIRSGWGEYHPVAGMYADAPPCLLMIYAPRSHQEIDIVFEISKSSYYFTVGLYI